jgi:hypothetical protein
MRGFAETQLHIFLTLIFRVAFPYEDTESWRGDRTLPRTPGIDLEGGMLVFRTHTVLILPVSPTPSPHVFLI